MWQSGKVAKWQKHMRLTNKIQFQVRGGGPKCAAKSGKVAK